MIRHCIQDGLRTGRGNFRLVALLWCWNLTLAFLGVLPAWLWLGTAFDFAPESDRMLSGFNFSLFAELSHYDRSPAQAMMMVSICSIALLAFLANPLVSGGLLATMMRDDDSKTIERFFRGAGEFFWRYLRLAIYAGITAVLVLLGVTAVFAPILRSAADSAWEPAPIVAGLSQTVLLVLLGAFFLIALDYARIRIAREDNRKVFRSWFWSLRFVIRHPVSAFGILGAMVLLFAVAVALYLGIHGLLPEKFGFAIALVILLQQVMMLVRTGLRVALVAGELAFYDRALPPIAETALPESSPPDPLVGTENNPTPPGVRY